MRINLEYEAHIDYSLSWQRRVDAAGFRSVEPGVTPEHFPVHVFQGKEVVNVTLFGFDGSLRFPKLVEEMDALGFWPMSFEEQIAYRLKDLKKFRGRAIIQLGTIADIRGNRHVTVNTYLDKVRSLRSFHFDATVNGEDCLFGFVRKDMRKPQWYIDCHTATFKFLQG